MWFLSVNTTHDAGVVLVRNNEIVVHLKEERLRHIKHAYQIVWCFDELKKYTSHIDVVCITGLWGAVQTMDSIVCLLEYHGLTDESTFFVHGEDRHHIYHAFCGFFSSPFEKATCIVLDGAGADLHKEAWHKENETIFSLDTDKSGNVIDSILYRSVTGYPMHPVESLKCYSRTGVGMVYNAISEAIGFGLDGEGKVMGLAPYAKSCSNINKFVDISVGSYASIFKIITNEKVGLVGTQPHNNSSLFKIAPKGIDNVKISPENNFNLSSQIAKRMQDDYEEYIINLVDLALELSECKNIIISGGCALNCVANYKILKHLPKDVNLYIDPISDDSGIALGMIFYLGNKDGSEWNSYADKKFVFDAGVKTIRKKYNPSYLGTQLEYDYTLKDNQSQKDVTVEDVARLLESGNVVAIAQGKAETGARALGNRSILFDPRVENGKEIVNKVKKREWWRPFAGTVLLEHAREWFDMDRLEESPHMTYAINVLPEKQKLIPSITHVDGTCRIQTVTQEQNKHYYDLISEFNTLTGVPILFNTSFNLAGDTIVDNMEDALKTLEESDIEYLYLPDIMKLIHVPNK